MATRPPASAVTYAESQSHRGTYWGIGMCLKFTRSCFNVPSRYSTAALAWANTRHRHSTTPPAGAPVWWTGGSRGFGHVALSAGGGYVWSTDVLRSGRVDRVKISHITNAWNLHYRGWSEDINGVRVHAAPAPVPNVHLAYIVEASIKDPGHLGRKTHPTTTLLVSRALYREGLLRKIHVSGHWGRTKRKAYAAWQRRLGYSGSDASGTPGMKSLHKLGLRRGFHAVP
jgi:hypothetical protein